MPQENSGPAASYSDGNSSAIGGYAMVTVIDMITGEIIHSSRAAAKPATSVQERPATWDCPALALHEVVSEPHHIRMPPELAHIGVEDFLRKI